MRRFALACSMALLLPAFAFAALLFLTAPAFADGGIQMLPPTDFTGTHPCATGATAGILFWNGVASDGSGQPIKCVPGFTGTSQGYLGINDTNPQYQLDIMGTGGLLQMGANNWSDPGDAGGSIVVDNGGFDSLMIVGNRVAGNTSQGNHREVGVWDDLNVHGGVKVGAVAPSDGNRACLNTQNGTIAWMQLPGDATSQVYVCNGSTWNPVGVAPGTIAGYCWQAFVSIDSYSANLPARYCGGSAIPPAQFTTDYRACIIGQYGSSSANLSCTCPAGWGIVETVRIPYTLDQTGIGSNTAGDGILCIKN